MALTQNERRVLDRYATNDEAGPWVPVAAADLAAARRLAAKGAAKLVCVAHGAGSRRPSPGDAALIPVQGLANRWHNPPQQVQNTARKAGNP